MAALAISQLTLPLECREPRVAALRHCLQIGVSALKVNRSPLDVVELVVRELENNPHFNAGKGSVLTSNDSVEMEACIMDSNKNCRAVSGLTTVVNAISFARLVLEKPPHIYLAFDGAEAFAREQRILRDGNKQKKLTEFRLPIEKEAKKETPIPDGDSQIGTVGCVAVDSHGNLAAATSTGGLVDKMAGRIRDTLVIGAGTYANKLCAVSATGKGEAIIRATIARDVAALMKSKGLSLEDAAAYVVGERAPQGIARFGCCVRLERSTMPFNTTGMFRACATEDGRTEVGIWHSVLSEFRFICLIIFRIWKTVVKVY